MLAFFCLILPALMRRCLKQTVLPSHYDLHVSVEQDKFHGTVVMHLSAAETVKTFQFNSKGLELSSLVVEKDKKTISSTFNADEDFVTVDLDEPVSGDFTLSVRYSAVYNMSMEGFYKSKYNENDLYSTHFEPTDARQAFPCFDQPDMKSTFAISIDVPEGFVALSNSALKTREGNHFVFEKTPKMSTYIVAYVIGKLDYIEDATHIPIRVYADASEKEWGRFALEVATRCLKFFESYFEFKYPLPKLDMVAIPSFAMGAMENWGLVTYRKTSLLFDEKSTSIRAKKNIAITVCHELAHMWFGNLVTMKWWNDLWLNEGFATWAATLAIEKSLADIMPWDAWTSFINDEIESGMKMDSLRCTHKIAVEVDNPAQIDQIFDAISYSKGSSVIKMLENWLGEEVFRQGLVRYINRFQYANAVTQDLWAALTEVATESGLSVDVSAIIDPWVSRPGFPYVDVSESGAKLKLAQKRFTVGFKAEETGPWAVPVWIQWIRDDQTEPDVKKRRVKSEELHMLDAESIVIEKKSSAFKLNNNVSGFYRVHYPESILDELLQQKLSASNRLNLFSDAFALTKALLYPLPYAMSLLKHLAAEDNYEVLLNVLSGVAYYRSLFYDRKAQFEHFTGLIRHVVDKRCSAVDLHTISTDINKASTDSLVVSYAVAVDNAEILEKFRSSDVSAIASEYMRSYFIARVDSDFDRLFELYKSSSRPGEKQHALVALGTTTIEKNIDTLFDRIGQVHPAESIYLFSSLGSNMKFKNKVAMLFIERFDSIRSHIGNSGLVRHAIEYLLAGIHEQQYRDRVFSFLEALDKSDGEDMRSAIDKCTDALNIGAEIRAKYVDFDFN